jgi:hypothetical protein
MGASGSASEEVGGRAPSGPGFIAARTLDGAGELLAVACDLVLLGLHRVLRPLLRWILREPARSQDGVPPLARRAKLPSREFIRRYVLQNRPVIVTDCIDEWRALGKWTPAFFAESFGDHVVTLQGETFNVVGSMRLRDYVASFPAYEVAAPEPSGEVPYLRFDLGRHLDHVLLVLGLDWLVRGSASRSFTLGCFWRLQRDWGRPYFLPSRFYWRPFHLFCQFSPNTKYNQEFGVFLSPKGAVTRLHADHARTNALIFQLHGRKSGVLYPPRWQEEMTRLGERGVEPIRFVLEPGDTIFIPRGWLHQVQTDSASVSLTFNFVCMREMLSYVAGKLVRGPGTALPPPAFDTGDRNVSS